MRGVGRARRSELEMTKWVRAQKCSTLSEPTALVYSSIYRLLCLKIIQLIPHNQLQLCRPHSSVPVPCAQHSGRPLPQLHTEPASQAPLFVEKRHFPISHVRISRNGPEAFIELSASPSR